MTHQWFDPRNVEGEIQKLSLRASRRGRFYLTDSSGISYSDLALHQSGAVRRLRRAVRHGTYRFGPVVPRQVTINGRIRTLFAASVLDTVVLSVLAKELSERLEPLLPPRLYSYRTGRSSWQAALELTRFLREHRTLHADPKTRGLYAVHRDILRYGESIPTSEDSPIWKELQTILEDSGFSEVEVLLGVLKEAIHPEVVNTDGTVAKLDVGVPTGSPLQPLFNNLYLAPLDRELETIFGAFYLRYGDDIIFLHPDPKVAKSASQTIDNLVKARGLEIHPHKRSERYYTGAGRPSSAWPQATGTSVLEYLGYAIHFQGSVSLKKTKRRELFAQLKRRWVQSHTLLQDYPMDHRIRHLCAVTNRAMDPFCHLAVPMAPALRFLVNDRGQLKDLDYCIASELAQQVSQSRGVRAFRKVPYRHLRRQGGLLSLLVARNRHPAKRRIS